MRKIYLTLGLIPLLASVFQVVRILDVFKFPEPFLGDFKSCRYLNDYAPGPEDITRYDESTLIYGSGDLGKLFNLGLPDQVVHGSFWAIYNAGEKDFSTKEIPIHGFPSGVRLQPHGIYVLKEDGQDYLYAISHAYDQGGERIEAFRINKDDSGFLELEYIRSIIFPEDQLSTLNDIVFISTKEFYYTQWLLYPHNIKGHKFDGLWYKLREFLIVLFGYKGTYVNHCSLGEDSSPLCKRLENTVGIMNNGITYDGKKIYTTDSLTKTIQVYSIESNGDLSLDEKISVGYGLDNVEFDPITKKIYLVGIEKTIQYLKLTAYIEGLNGSDLPKDEKLGYWTSVYSIDTSQTKLVVKKELVVQDVIKGASSAYMIGQNVFLASFADQSLAVCQK